MDSIRIILPECRRITSRRQGGTMRSLGKATAAILFRDGPVLRCGFRADADLLFPRSVRA